MAWGLSKAVPILIALSLGASAAQVASFSGTWRLNVEKSKWGKLPKPISLVVTIVHEEPKLEYGGTIVYASEDTRSFDFNGAVDGKEYPATRTVGEGKVALKRADARTISSVFRSIDGQFVEEATTSVSRDGKLLRREIRRTGPEGVLKWTEVYEKQ